MPLTTLPDHSLNHVHQQTAALSLWNTIACYHSKLHILRSYQGLSASSQITDFAARMSGTSTLLSFAVRACAAYKIHNPEIYFLAQWTFGVALLHFVGELLVFRTMRLGQGVVPVMTVATVGTVWMGVQRGFYLGQ